MTKIVLAEESSISFSYTETIRHDMTELAAKAHIEVARSKVDVARHKTSPARWASVAISCCVTVLVLGILGVILLTTDWRIAVAGVLSIAGMGGYILKGPLNKIIGAVADSIGK